MVASDESDERASGWYDAPVSRRNMLRVGVVGAAGIASLLLSDTKSARAAGGAGNPIVTENALPGTDQWRITLNESDDSTRQICGFASATSVNVGDTITLFVTVNPAQTFTLDVYRIGHYQGLGGRLMLHDSVSGITQPAPAADPATGMVSCAWSAGYRLTIPAGWTTGIYLVKLTSSAQYQSYITFVVRDDSSTSALLYQQSVTTYQAYNNFPNDVANGATLPSTGKSLYEYNSSATPTAVGTTRANKVSFDRPYSNDDGAGDFLDWELFFVRWMEQAGYDVSYSTDLDTHTDATRLTRHRGFLAVGHDEYWSGAMYDGVSNALASGVGLGFFGADAIYWQIRFEANAAGTPNRVQVCYKDAAKDPVNGAGTTVLWRNPVLNRPEQQLLGSMFVSQQPNGATPAPFVVRNSSHWVYRGSGAADGDSIPGIVGYECDRSQAAYPLPVAAAGTYTLLSDSPFTTSLTATDGSGQAITEHCTAVVYQAASGAWVFNAGSIEWNWGLSNINGRTSADARIQQMTANVLDTLVAGPVPIPPAPSGLAAVPTDHTTVGLSWTDNSSGASGVVVERSASSSFGTVTSTPLSAGTTTFNDTGLTPGVYYYRLRAVNNNGSSPYCGVAAVSTVAYNDLVQGRSALCSHWRLGDRIGAVAADSKGSFDGSYLNGVTLGAAGALARDGDTAAQFNGSNQKVSLPALPGTVDFTVVGWTFLTSAPANSTLYGTNGNVRILVRPGNGASAYGGVWLNGTEYALQPTTAQSNLNAWVHWALTRQGSTLTLYRNGVQVAQRSDLPASAAANVSGWIGAQSGNAYYFAGRIDEVAVYTAALSGDDVSNDYSAGTNGIAPDSVPPVSYRDLVMGESSLLAYWRLDDSAGKVATDLKGGFSGQYVNNPTLGAPGALAADPDTCVAFNGTNNKVSLPALPAVTDFTFEGWSYLTGAAVNNSNGNNALYGTNNQVRILTRPGAPNTGTDVLAGVWLNNTEYTLQPSSAQSDLNTWVHWVLTRGGGTLTLYRNGVQVAQRTDLPASAPANLSGWIGSQGGSAYYFNGRIDEVAVYQAALRPSAVVAHYAAAVNGTH
ncbi:MAG TPA: N,N-dimethylformamidase beta subunit family domain-containing protein [Jatrophihabitans sp.]